ncbi:MULTISPECIES: SGNH/GDSL hydrolase family protein [unclassified Saccharothrix]|uniref:SGNH/GDSL hydrolase family protein n=1 Tax=unclassified Saccharothrix TaxID=2593673 RepID=UPI00307D3E53
MAYSRFVALGDSQTEGIGDGDDLTGHRGWADRLAQRLAATEPSLTYANLAVRGKLAVDVRREQLAPALALRPDLASVVAGMNDLLRPKFSAAEVGGHLEAVFEALTGAGAHVVTVTFPDIGVVTPLARPLRPRVLALNAAIRAAAGRHGVTVVDTHPYPAVCDARLWSADRLHANAAGHALIADAVAHGLGLPGSDDSWRRPFPDPAARATASTELRWLAGFLAPWLLRRVRGRSSGDGRTAKRPDLLPLP